MNELFALILPSNEATMSTNSDHHGCLNGNSSALEQAKGFQANYSGQFPSFLKQLLKSHLSGKFYLGLPKKFCDAHMPSHDGTIVLVDENEQEYNTKYTIRKNRLSGGWRGFSIAHKLLEGDTLVFHLVEPCKFRVYIVRASKLTAIDGVTGLPTCDYPNIKPISSVKMEDEMEDGACIGKPAMQIYINSFDDHHVTKKARLTCDHNLDTGQFGNDIDNFNCDVLEGNRYSQSEVYFKDVKGFEDFKIQADGLNLDSEIPINLRTEYYNLCCSKKMFLHDCLIKGLSSKLAVVMICETINIADAIRSANLGTSLHYLDCWEKTLKAFEDLGMAVGFLRDRLQKLIGISREFQAIIESTRIKSVQADDHVSNLEGEIEALKWKNKKLGFEFQMLAQAPW